MRLNETTYRHVIPSERSESRNLPELQILSCVGSFYHVVDSSTPPCSGRNDISGSGPVYPHRLFLQCFLERPMCRSAPKKDGTVSEFIGYVPHYVIPTAASAEWRNLLRWIKNQHKIKHVTWEDPSNRFRSLGMTDRESGSD